MLEQKKKILKDIIDRNESLTNSTKLIHLVIYKPIRKTSQPALQNRSQRRKPALHSKRTILFTSTPVRIMGLSSRSASHQLDYLSAWPMMIIIMSNGTVKSLFTTSHQRKQTRTDLEANIFIVSNLYNNKRTNIERTNWRSKDNNIIAKTGFTYKAHEPQWNRK